MYEGHSLVNPATKVIKSPLARYVCGTAMMKRLGLALVHEGNPITPVLGRTEVYEPA